MVHRQRACMRGQRACTRICMNHMRSQQQANTQAHSCRPSRTQDRVRASPAAPLRRCAPSFCPSSAPPSPRGLPCQTRYTHTHTHTHTHTRAHTCTHKHAYANKQHTNNKHQLVKHVPRSLTCACTHANTHNDCRKCGHLASLLSSQAERESARARERERERERECF